MGLFGLSRSRRSIDEAEPSGSRLQGRTVTASARRARFHQSSDLQEEGGDEDIAVPADAPTTNVGIETGYGEDPSVSRHYQHHDDDYDDDGDEDRDDDAEGGARASTSRGRDESWLLREPAPGGPVVIDLIPSFGGHIALDIWLGKEVEFYLFSFFILNASVIVFEILINCEKHKLFYRRGVCLNASPEFSH